MKDEREPAPRVCRHVAGAGANVRTRRCRVQEVLRTPRHQTRSREETKASGHSPGADFGFLFHPSSFILHPSAERFRENHVQPRIRPSVLCGLLGRRVAERDNSISPPGRSTQEAPVRCSSACGATVVAHRTRCRRRSGNASGPGPRDAPLAARWALRRPRRFC